MNWFSSLSEVNRDKVESESPKYSNQCEDQDSSHEAVCQNLMNRYNAEQECPPPWDRRVLFSDEVVGETRMQFLDPSGEPVSDVPVGLNDVFRFLCSSWHRPLKVLLRGEAGMGKTTLCNRIIFEWKSNGGMLPGSGSGAIFLIYFRLRSLGREDDLETELFKFLNGSFGSRSCKTEGPDLKSKDFKLVLLLDGYNELNATLQKQVADLVSASAHFQNSSILVTSRPDVEREFIILFDRHLVLSGLSVKAADALIRKYYHNSDCFVNFMMSKFGDILRKYKMSPLLLVMLCYLQRHNFEGKLETFEQVVYHCTFEIYKRTSQCQQLKNKSSEEKIQELGRYFMECLHEKKFVFPLSEVEAILPDSVLTGLFRKVKYVRDSQNSVEVVHSCFMEVLAMHYVNELWYSPSNGTSLTSFVPRFVGYLSSLEVYAYKDCSDEVCFKVIGESKGLGNLVWDFKDGSCIFSTCLNKSLIPRNMGRCKLNVNFSLTLQTNESFSSLFTVWDKILSDSSFMTQVKCVVSQFDSLPLQINFLFDEEFQLCNSATELYAKEPTLKRTTSLWTELRDMATDINLTFLGKGCNHQDIERVMRNMMDLDLKLEKETAQATELLSALKKCNETNFICTLAGVARLGQYYLVDTKRRYAFEDLRSWTKKKFFQPKYNWDIVDMFVVSWRNKVFGF